MQVVSAAPLVLTEARDALMSDRRWTFVDMPPNAIDFWPLAWAAWLPDIGAQGSGHAWIYARLCLNDGRITCAVEVGPMRTKYASQRFAILDDLHESCCRAGIEVAAAVEHTQRPCSISAVITLGSCAAHKLDLALIRQAMNEMIDELYPKLESVGRDLQSLTGSKFPPAGSN